MTCYHSQNSNLNINLLYCLSNTNRRLAKSVCKIFVVALAFSDCKLVVVKFIIVFVMLQFDWLCDVHGCVMSPTLGIYWVDLGFINNYKESELWLVLLRYSADVTSAFPWVVTYGIRAGPVIPCGLRDTTPQSRP